MLNIIRIEWLKVKNYRTFWILLILAIIVIPASNMIVADVVSRIPKQATELLGKNFYDFPVVWQTVANVNSFTSVIFGLLLVTLVTNEFSYKTHRQQVIDGWERIDFVLSKVFWVVALALIALVVSFITAIAFGTTYSTFSFSFEGIQFLFFYFLQVLVSLSLALLLGMFIKRSGLATVIYLGYTMVLEQLLTVGLKHSFGAIGGLLPLQAGDELLPFPVVDKVLPGSADYGHGVYEITIILYIALFIGLTCRRMLRVDY
ncbi:ABC transporter permease [Chitinophaga sp.]|uniref:ABC transporter permease n=1 Tax=Chitinophaga sp. TaxID=1869181 RepID=UPI0031E22F41